MDYYWNAQAAQSYCDQADAPGCTNYTELAIFGAAALVGVAVIPEVAAAIARPIAQLLFGVCVNDGDCTNEAQAGINLLQRALQFTPHALQRMVERGVSASQVQTIVNAQQPFPYFHAGVWKTGYYDAAAKIFVGELQGIVTTVITNVKPQYIENLKKATP